MHSREVFSKFACVTGWLPALLTRSVRPFFDPDKLDAERMKKLFADTLTARGACKVDKPIGGDGKTQARLVLSCERYPVVLDFTLGEQSGKVEAVRFDPVDFRTGKCVQ